MTENWEKAVEETADLIGEMMVKIAEGKESSTYDEIARAALKAGIVALLGEGPSESRVGEAASVIYEKLHDSKGLKWPSLPQMERGFWIDIAQAVTSASDRQFIKQAHNLQLSQRTGN